METSSFRSLPADFGMDDALMSHHIWPTIMSTAPHHVELSTESITSLIYENFQHSYSQQQSILDFKRPAEEPRAGPWLYRPSKQLKPTCWLGMGTGMVKEEEEEMRPPSSYQHSNSSLNSPCGNTQQLDNYSVKPAGEGCKRSVPVMIGSTGGMAHSTPQDHVVAERMRREKISQRFIALSALVPGLKKMDKASVLADAAEYLKQLQERIKILEQQASKKKTFTEKLVFVKKFEIGGAESSCTDDDDHADTVTTAEPLPEIQARFSDKDVLIIINCEKTKGVLERAVAEIEKLNLSIINTSVMAFGDSALNITLLAKKDDGFTSDTKDLVNNLRYAAQNFYKL